MQVKLLIKYLILIFSLFTIFVFYRSEIYWLGNRREAYLLYQIVSLISILFLVIVYYLHVKIQEYVIIILISTICTFYIFEGLLLFQDKKLLNEKKFDTRSIFQVYKDLKKNNKNITVALTSSKVMNVNGEKDILNLSGISNTETILCNNNGYYSVYYSDRYGFNNPDVEWDSEAIDFLVGDSFTHGACVNRPNDIASFLRLYSKKNVINLGQSGNGPLLNYATLREYLSPKARNVLWLHYEGNDILDLKKELKNETLRKYLNNKNFSQDLTLKQDQIDQFLANIILEQEKDAKYEDIFNFIKMRKIRNILVSKLTPKIMAHDDLPPPELKIILESANELVKNYNGKLFFIYLPEILRYKFANFKEIDQKTKVKKIVNDLNIQFIDIDEEVFQKEINPLKFFPFGKFGHYNAEGYKKVALKIYEKITK